MCGVNRTCHNVTSVAATSLVPSHSCQVLPTHLKQSAMDTRSSNDEQRLCRLWLFCVLHKIRMVAADGLDAQSLGTDVYCVIVCHWFPRDMSEYTTSVPSDCALTLFGAGTSGTAMLKHISSTLAQSPVIVQWLVYRPGCAPLTALTGGAVCCHLLTASGAPSDDRIAAVMVLCA